MKVSDYIVEFFADKGITDVFGYPGGMVTHLLDSFHKYQDKIQAHVNYHEQASAFSACGYAQVAMKPGVAYATSGPGATNLITGICNAYFDSIPTIFITGQVNTFEAKMNLSVRQKGFQETDIISLVKDVTKFCAYIEKPEDIKLYLEKAYYYATEGRPGPVVLDIPMNVQRADIISEDLPGFVKTISIDEEYDIENIINMIMDSRRPCIIIGSGVKTSGSDKLLRSLVNKIKIPVVSSMIAIDILPSNSEYNFGFLGAYGNRFSNFIVAKCDLIIALGTRLDIRQIGGRKDQFAVNAKLIRVDIDHGELTNKVKENEIQINANVKNIISKLEERIPDDFNKFNDWIKICSEIKNRLRNIDIKEPNLYIERISEYIPDYSIITTDVGQNQVWVSQSFKVKPNQRILFSGGHGAMGYSLPAAIGAYYASRLPIVSFNGDGGFQMNIQELQFIAREQIPINIIILNNSALGMIRHFQEMYFDSNYTQTVEDHGYSVPDFEMVSNAYGIKYTKICSIDDVSPDIISKDAPKLIEIVLEGNTYVYPKLEYGKPNQDQEPQIDRYLYEHIMKL